jgi:O-succinylbenzoate synthase
MNSNSIFFRNIEWHRYTLKPRAGLTSARSGARSGALLRVTFEDLEKPGHADLFPWTEYGDPSLDTWISELRGIGHGGGGIYADSANQKLSKTLQIAIRAARDEAEATARNEPLIKGSVVNHALSTDPCDLAVGDIIEARRSTFPAIKIKIGRKPAREEAAALARLVSHWGIKLRLDANERATREDLMIFLDALPIRIRETLEFIEDPFPFDLKKWSEFHRETGIAVAYDRGLAERASDTTAPSLSEIFESGAAQVLIHKPAWQDDDRAHFARDHNYPVVVTSILGHAIGNIWAASKAAQLAPDGVHGCMSHTAYKDDEAAKVLIKSKQAHGCRMIGIGVGLGLQSKWFDRLRWEE